MVARPGRRAAATAVTIGAVSSALFLGGCGQEFTQDGGTVPVPRATTEGALVATPEAAPDAQPLVDGSYAPPRSAGPTQTAIPNVPGGKY
ncbi:MAG: hypothetical protein IRZ08_05330 [Frankia sp.]|nr:hypothetical protein [Frankia sp.]